MHRPKQVQEILAAREAGKSCREIAEGLGWPEWRIHNIMKSTGNQGKWHAKPKYSTRRQPAGKRGDRWANIVDTHGSLYIESGSWAGYIATIDDQWTGSEQPTINDAIASAIDAMKQAT